MSLSNDAGIALSTASSQISDCEKYLTACALQISEAMGLVHTASNGGFSDLKGKITKLLNEVNDLALGVRSVAGQVSGACVGLMD